MASSNPFLNLNRAAPVSHAHVDDEVCPLCEQPIPHDQFDEINERIEARERERSAEIGAKLQGQFDQEKARLLANAEQEAAAKAASARAEERERAQATIREKLAEAEQTNRETQETLRSQIADTEAAIAKLKEDAVANETEIRAAATREAEATAQKKIEDNAQAHLQAQAALRGQIELAETAKAKAEQGRSTLLDQLEKAKRDQDAQIEQMKQDAAFRESEVRREAAQAADTAFQEKMAAAEKAKSEAEAKALEALNQLNSMQQTHDVQLTERLNEQREALENAQTVAVNAEKSAAYEEKLKLIEKVAVLQRTLEKKTAEELGEGAEVDLFEALKAEFASDRIERVNKGQPGADILHVVIHNGKECGTIIYDSKNHGAWRNDFVIKLAADQMAARAEHAILSTRAFPSGARHLHVQSGVVLANPSRVTALVQIVRQHLVQTHKLRLSNEERVQKTAELYSFITSERCVDLLGRIDSHADDLLDLQVKEKKAHEATWKRQGELIRSVQRVRAELCTTIDGIIGTGETREAAE